MAAACRIGRRLDVAAVEAAAHAGVLIAGIRVDAAASRTAVGSPPVGLKDVASREAGLAGRQRGIDPLAT